MKLLAVDTCLGACSVALIDDDRILAHRCTMMDRGHAEALAPMVEDAMAAAELPFAEVESLAVTVGPGTFTGQRVGLAFMRGLRVALKRPLIAVTSLETMAHQAAAETHIANVAALHDAKRDEVYLEITSHGATTLAPAVLPFSQALEILSNTALPLALCGTAAPRAAGELKSATLSTIRQPDALWTARIARTRPPPDTAPRPLYLRAPDARLPGGVKP